MNTIKKKNSASPPRIRASLALFGFFGSDMLHTYKFNQPGHALQQCPGFTT